MINWNIYILECITMVLIFTAMIMIPLCKNPIWWIHDYPEDIQEAMIETYNKKVDFIDYSCLNDVISLI